MVAGAMARRRTGDDTGLTGLATPDLVPAESRDGGYTPVGELITERIRDAILGGRIEPGTWVRQEALASEFGVSRIPVREALRQLEREGLVTNVPHRGARVAQLDLQEHLEIYRIREALEPIALAESATRIEEPQLEELRAMELEFEQLGTDPQRWLEADRRFHLATYAAAPMPRLLEMIESFWNSTQHYRRAYLTMLDEAGHRLVYYEHALILDALERHDPVDAEARQRSHLRRTRLMLLDHPEVFRIVRPAAPDDDGGGP